MVSTSFFKIHMFCFTPHQNWSTIPFLLLVFLVYPSPSIPLTAQTSPDQQQNVNRAIKNGLRYLRRNQRRNGTWNMKHGNSYPAGETALTLLALLESGANPKHSSIRKALDFLTSYSPRKTYSVSIFLMALKQLFSPEKKQKKNNNSSTDQRSNSSGINPKSVSREARKRAVRSAEWLLGTMHPQGAWTYNRPQNSVQQRILSSSPHGFVLLNRKFNQNRSRTGQQSDWDHSNSQYGVLGLHAASLLGIRFHKNIWKTLLEHWIDKQSDKKKKLQLKWAPVQTNQNSGTQAVTVEKSTHARSWGYKGSSSRTRLSMTAAGVSSVQIAMHHLKKQNALPKSLRKKAKSALTSGLARIQQKLNGNFSFQDAQSSWNFYTIYGIERAMMLTKTGTLGGIDWYRKGASALLDLQNKDGSWGEKQEKIVSTCFALLFLNRSTTPTSTTFTPEPEIIQTK